MGSTSVGAPSARRAISKKLISAKALADELRAWQRRRAEPLVSLEEGAALVVQMPHRPDRPRRYWPGANPWQRQRSGSQTGTRLRERSANSPRGRALRSNAGCPIRIAMGPRGLAHDKRHLTELPSVTGILMTAPACRKLQEDGIAWFKGHCYSCCAFFLMGNVGMVMCWWRAVPWGYSAADGDIYASLGQGWRSINE